jgi:hypothetical protein
MFVVPRSVMRIDFESARRRVLIVQSFEPIGMVTGVDE